MIFDSHFEQSWVKVLPLLLVYIFQSISKKHIKLKLLDRIIPIDLYYYSTTWSRWVTNDLIEKISWTVVIKDDWCNELLNDGSDFFYTDFFTYFVCSVVMFTVDSICKIVQNKIKLDDVLLFFITGIPRLTQFFLAGFHFTRIFAKICIARFYITYKISVLWEFFWQFFLLYYDSHSANFT